MIEKANTFKTKLYRFWALVLFFISVFSTPAGAETNELETLDKAIQNVIKKYEVPAVAYAVIRGEQLPHVQSHGFINRDSMLKAEHDTPFQVASISKAVVGIAVMQLVEQGRLDLDDKVAELLPEFAFSNPWESTSPLRLVHLLENTTGWDEISLKEFAYVNMPPLDLLESLQVNANSRHSRWPPGTRHAYTNSAATVAALIVEKSSGMSFYSYVEKSIFKPLSITSARYLDANEGGPVGYKKGRSTANNSVLMRPSGALNISISDMAKLVKVFLDRGVPLLSKDTVERMERSESTNVGVFKAGYGIYNYARYYDGVRYRGHDGARQGWLSELSYSPKHNVGFVVLQNSEHGRAFREIVKLISTFVAKDFIFGKLDVKSLDDNWKVLSGYYRAQNPRVSKRYFLERLVSVNKLVVSDNDAIFQSAFPPGWKRKLTYSGENTWQNNKGEQVMRLGADPLLGEVIHYGDRVFTRVSSFGAWIDKITLVIWILTLLSFFIFSIRWAYTLPTGKVATKEARRFRIALIAANISAVCFLAFLVLGLTSAIERLGNIGLFSLGLMFSSVVFTGLTLYACWTAFILRKAYIKPLFYSYSAIYLTTQLVVVIYLGIFGVIGIQSWS